MDYPSLPVHESRGLWLDSDRQHALNSLNELVYQGAIRVEAVRRCFCGSCRFRRLSRFDRFGLPFGTQICGDCGLITQTTRIAPESLPLFYEEIYWPLVTGRSHYSTPPKPEEDAPYVMRHVPASWPDVAVFEVGCGSGARLLQLREHFHRRQQKARFVGCDYSAEALAQARAYGFDVVRGGIESLERHGRADVLILSHVFEHLPDLEDALSGIERLTHNDSVVYVEVPGVADLENKPEYDYDYQTYCVLAHTFNFSLSTLSGVFATRGFVLVEGDEFVRSVFKKSDTPPPIESAYDEIMGSLERARAKHLRLTAHRNDPLRKYVRNVAKALLGRV